MANIKNDSEAGRVYPGYHERYGSSIIAWATSRGRIRTEFGLLLSYSQRSSSLIPTSLVAAELAAMFQDKQGGVFRWVGEAYGKTTGIPRHLGTMDRKYDLVSDRIDFRCRIHRLHRNERSVHDMSLANNKYYTLAVVLNHLLAGYISFH